jgi:hypothetical protein
MEGHSVAHYKVDMSHVISLLHIFYESVSCLTL